LLALAFALMLALAACGGGDDDDTAADDTSEPTEQSEDTESDDTEADDASEDTDDASVSDECEEFVEALSSTDEITNSDDPSEAIEGLRDFADEIAAAAGDAPDEIREDVEILADVYGEIAEQLEDVDVDDIDEGDPQSIIEAFQALQPLFQTFSSEDFIEASTNIARFCAGSTDLGELDGSGALGDVIGGSSESGLDEETSDCDSDTSANGRGDNEGCDALYDECEDGDMHACNDLYFAAAIGSDYEEFGGTCGGRIESGDPGANGFCEDADV
jgi:hypothetical protein